LGWTPKQKLSEIPNLKKVFFLGLFSCGSSECGKEDVRAAITGGEQSGDSLSMKPDDNARATWQAVLWTAYLKNRFDDLKN